jgi:glycosyltransferase involved in cell wall biosynthesis
MTDAPAFSVIVPCYNAEHTIAETLQSVADQSFRDWEAIVLDDGSTDDSADIVEALIRREARMRLIRRKNSGVSVTRNAGAAAARGRSLAFLDADDCWHPDYLQRMAAHLDSHPGIGIAFAVARIVDGEGRPTGSFSSRNPGPFTTFDFLSSNPTTTCSNLVVRRDVFAALGGFREDLCHAEDQLFLIRAHLAGIGVEGCGEPLVDYRVNAAGLSSDLEAMRRGWEAMAAEALKEAPDAIGPLMPRARALNLCYLARRALRLDRASDSWRYMSAALRSDPSVLLARPWPTIPLAVACRLASLSRRQPSSLAEKSP